MKKVLAVIIALILVFGVSACSQTLPIRSIRWKSDQTEELTYDVRLVHSLSYNEKNEDGSFKTDDNGNIIKTSADKNILPETADQVKPIDAIGHYTTKIAENDGSTDIVTGALDLTEIYDITLFDDATIAELRSKNLIDEGLSTTASIAVKTTISSKCVFDSVSLKPVSSQKQVKGVYVGKDRVAINDYSVDCTYSNNTCEIKFVNNTNPSASYEKTVSFSGTEYFDNEMLLYLVRSYDPTQMTSAVSVNLMEPLINQSMLPVYMQAATENVYFDEGKTMDVYMYAVAPASEIGIYVALTTQEVQLVIDGAPHDTNKIVKFQQGYLVYTLSEEQLDATFDSIAERKAQQE